MLIQNVHVDNQKDAVDVRIEDGKFAAIKPGLSAKPGEEVIDGQGKVLLPPFIDSHVHLDATLTAGQPEWNETGTLLDVLNGQNAKRISPFKTSSSGLKRRCSIWLVMGFNTCAAMLT